MQRLCTKRSRRFDPWRKVLFGIFAVLAYWRWSLPEGETSFIQFTAPAYGRESFEIVDPDEARKPVAGAKKPARKYETFAHRVLDIDAGEAPVSQAKYALLDSIIDDAKRRVSYDAKIDDPKAMRRQAQRVLGVIDEVLTDHNVLYPPGDYDVTSLRAGLTPQHYDKAQLDRILDVGLNGRRRKHARAHADEPFYILDCDISSIVYVGVGEALRLDLHLVDLPDHMFVRWKLGDGSHLNWDTNSARTIPDAEYASDYDLGKRIRKERIYLATMTRREEEGYAYFLRATRSEEDEQNTRAIADLVKARELYPQSTQAASELAWLYATTDGIDAEHHFEAIDLAEEALAYEPKCGEFWDSLAAAHASIGEFKRAAEEAKKAEYLAETPEERQQFKQHRKAFEKEKMVNGARIPH
jgi:hypothetical protein